MLKKYVTTRNIIISITIPPFKLLEKDTTTLFSEEMMFNEKV